MSEGKFDYGWREQQDARAAFDFLLNRKEVDQTAALVVGRSLGGTIAVYSLADDPRVKGLTLWASPPDHYQNIKNSILNTRGRFGYLMFLLISFVDRFHNVPGAMRLDVFGLKLRLGDLRRKLMRLRPARLLLSSGNHAPILLIVGDRDEYVSLAEAEKYGKIINGRKQLIVLPGTGHTFKGAEEKVVSLTLDWFRELLSSQSSRQPVT